MKANLSKKSQYIANKDFFSNEKIKAEFILKCNTFSSLSNVHISIFDVMSIYLTDQYQNAIPKAMLLLELGKKSLSRVFDDHDTSENVSSDRPH